MKPQSHLAEPVKGVSRLFEKLAANRLVIPGFNFRGSKPGDIFNMLRHRVLGAREFLESRYLPPAVRERLGAGFDRA